MLTRISTFPAAIALGLATLATSAVAQPIDNFDIGVDPSAGEYTAGQLSGQNPSIIGWAGAWREGFQGDNPQVVATGLTYSDGVDNLPVSGGAVSLGTSDLDSGRVARDLANPINAATVGTQYFSFLFQAENAVNDPQITYGGLELHNANGIEDADRQFQLVVGENTDGVGQSPNFQAVLFNSDATEFFGDLGTNNGDVNLFVLKFDLSDEDDMDSISVFRNPSLAAEPAVPDFTATGFNIDLATTSFARFGEAGELTVDELRLGNTYESVTQPVAAFFPGDSDGDFTVEFEDDFFPIRDNWLETNATFGSTLTRADGDLDLSGSVDLRDFREWKDAFNPSPAQLQVALSSLGLAVPEPGTLALVGLVCLAGLGRSRR